MDSHVDLIVIGTGAGAGSVACKCRSAGWSVTVVDSRPCGATCQRRWCDPKKVLVDDETERILDAHLLGAHAEEVINLFALAIRSGLRASDVKHTVYAYPTSPSDVSYLV